MKKLLFPLILFLLLPCLINQGYAQEKKKITMAVLYFENNSIVDKDKLEPLGKGIADMLITELTKIKSFKVVERERLNDILNELKLSQSGAVDQSTAQKIGKLLGAQTLLMGSFVNSFGNKMRVDLRIVETETGLTLKAEQVTEDVDELFEIVETLAKNITEEMDIKLTSEEQASLEQNKSNITIESSLLFSQAVDLEDVAREQYKTGNMRGAVDNYQKAVELYQAALNKNPNLSEANTKKENVNQLINIIQTPEVKIDKIAPPTLTVLQPVDIETGSIVHKESVIAVKLKVEDPSGVAEVTVNNNKAEKLSSGEYIANLTLVPGMNDIFISAANMSGYKSEKSFKVFVPTQAKEMTITILEPPVTRGIKIVSKKDVVTVKGIVSDLAGVDEVYVNNRKATVNSDGTFNIMMNLEVGDNHLNVKAINKNKAVKEEQFTITRNAEELIAAGKYVALIIGVNSYSGYWRPLTNAVNDAKGMADLLQKQYKFDQIITLFDKEATRKNIIQKFEWLANNLSKEDNLLIFYAGHGQLNKVLNKGFWVPVDASTNSVADYISNSDIKTFLGGIPTKHTFLITDACFAGDIFRGSTGEQVQFDPNNMEKYYKEVYRKQSRIALTSGGLEEVMDAGKDGHSVFTYYLLKALSDNTKKYIDAAQLFNEFRVAVANNSEQTPQMQSIKDTNDEGGQFVFIKK